MTDQSTTPRLRKSATDRIIDGVCGGVASYLRIDTTLVRIGWVLLALAGGLGIILYLAAMVIMPSPIATEPRPKTGGGSGAYLVGGIFLIAAGVMWILSETHLLPFHSIAWFSWKAILPALLIAAGLFLLLRPRSVPGEQSRVEEPSLHADVAPRKLHRSRSDKKLFGVCGGLGTYFDVDPVFVRILFVAFAIASFGFAILAYLLFSIVVPEEPITFAL